MKEIVCSSVRVKAAAPPVARPPDTATAKDRGEGGRMSQAMHQRREPCTRSVHGWSGLHSSLENCKHVLGRGANYLVLSMGSFFCSFDYCRAGQTICVCLAVPQRAA